MTAMRDWRGPPSRAEVLAHNHRTGGDCFGPWLRLPAPDTDEVQIVSVVLLAADGISDGVVTWDDENFPRPSDALAFWRPIDRRGEDLPWP